MKTTGLAAGLAFALVGLVAGPTACADDTPYAVADGNKVDKITLEGWRTWRARACERCHGARQEGLVGPPLVESLKRLSKEEFKQTMMKGRPEKGMPNFDGSKMVTENLDGLYAYLKGRSDGAIRPGRLEELK
ncbi:MAG: methanol dehydrogenase [Betaproteobacteria bacterium]|nr:MAG: methanol dehydrogenase [Betaproteobacteria bacterium]